MPIAFLLWQEETTMRKKTSSIISIGLMAAAIGIPSARVLAADPPGNRQQRQELCRNCNVCDAHGTEKFARVITTMPVNTMKKSAISVEKFKKTGGTFIVPTVLTGIGIVIGAGVGINSYSGLQ